MINVRGAWSLLGGMLSLIALYLLLTNSRGLSRGISSLLGGAVPVIRALQGR